MAAQAFRILRMYIYDHHLGHRAFFVFLTYYQYPIISRYIKHRFAEEIDAHGITTRSATLHLFDVLDTIDNETGPRDSEKAR